MDERIITQEDIDGFVAEGVSIAELEEIIRDIHDVTGSDDRTVWYGYDQKHRFKIVYDENGQPESIHVVGTQKIFHRD